MCMLYFVAVAVAEQCQGGDKRGGVCVCVSVWKCEGKEEEWWGGVGRGGEGLW